MLKRSLQEFKVDPLAVGNRIDAMCDEFERACKLGTIPSITTFMDCCQSVDQPMLFGELLRIEVEYLRQRSESIPWEVYRAQYSGFADQIETVRMTSAAFRDTLDVANRNQRTPLQAGTSVARFELVVRLGQGSVGDVWQARDTRLQRYVALKIPHSRDLSETELCRFLREGKSAAQLRHPNIVTVHEVDRDGELLFIVSDFVDGEDLRGRLERGPIPCRDAAAMCAKLADALYFAHMRGITHRDLKPANIMLDRQGEPHIADFGLAKWTSDSTDVTLNGELLGTPAYMPPEQAQGDVDQIDCRSDVYSLGVVLYEMLTGERPFQGTRAATIYKIVHEEPKSPRAISPHLPTDLAAICRTAIQKDPRDRYQTSQDFADDLRRYLNHQPVAAFRSHLGRTSWLWARRHRAVAAAVLMAIIALCSIGVAAIFVQRSHQLLGYRDVTLSTDPPGARLTLVLLHESTGEPVPQSLVQLADRSPTQSELAPGEYLVVAVLDDGRFHEVLRHVPKPHETSGIYKHNRWTISPRGAVVLPAIVIPDLRVTEGMAKVERDVLMDSALSSRPRAASNRAAASSFYLDTTEFTAANYLRLSRNVRFADRRSLHQDPFKAATVSFDEALAAAETIGKRLPTESEFEAAAALMGTAGLPWESIPKEQQSSPSPSDFGAVGSPSFDALPTQPSVFGLYSNVAEWTSSRPSLDSHEGAGFAIHGNVAFDYRVVKGGDWDVVNGANLLSATHRDFRTRVGISRFDVKAGLGFRCARSEKPRENVEDFPMTPASPNPEPPASSVSQKTPPPQ